MPVAEADSKLGIGIAVICSIKEALKFDFFFMRVRHVYALCISYNLQANILWPYQATRKVRSAFSLSRSLKGCNVDDLPNLRP